MPKKLTELEAELLEALKEIRKGDTHAIDNNGKVALETTFETLQKVCSAIAKAEGKED